MTERRWLAALAFSLLVHVLVVGSPGWRLPFFDTRENVLLEAHIAPKPAPSPPPPVLAPQPPTPPLPKAQPQPRRTPAPPAVEPAPAAAELAPLAEAPAPPVAAPPAPAAPTPVDIPWPRQGRIVFAVTRGEGSRACNSASRRTAGARRRELPAGDRVGDDRPRRPVPHGEDRARARAG